jgi:methyl-accepting chemotaxis protein
MRAVEKGKQRGGLLSRFRNLTIAKKISTAMAVGALALVNLTLFATYALHDAGNASQLLLKADVGVRAAAEADMMHEGVNADVLQSLLFTGARYADSRKLLARDTATMKAALDTVARADLPGGVNAAVTAVMPAVDDYLRAADQISRQAGADKTAAHAAYPKFLVAFDKLEGQLPSIANALPHGKAVKDAAETRAMWMQLLLVATGFGGVVTLLLAGWLVARSVSRPLKQAVTVLEGLAEGRLDLTLDVDSKDEVGQMALALNAAMGQLRETMGAMGDNAQGLASSSEELSAVSAQMTGSAEESASQANLVSAAAEQVSRNVQTVATGTEQMSASIREIAKSAHDAAGVAAQAVYVAETTSATVAKLGESSAEIGNVIKVINSIAEQTNLLALNATIEAARAGEAGKGFAVVANEVKELAQETAKATKDIGRRIQAIQSDTEAAVAAITEISGIIAQINDTQSTIASAVEEQTATTNEMGRNVSEAATGSSDIAENITGVARSASETTAAASSTSQAADELARMASDLRQLVGQFSY